MGVDAVFGYDHFHKPFLQLSSEGPELLSDMARAVDYVSGGRLVLGLGSGWYLKDYEVYGYDFGTVGSRMKLFVDGLQRIEDRLGQLKPIRCARFAS